jgi:hypothetical protein
MALSTPAKVVPGLKRALKRNQQYVRKQIEVRQSPFQAATRARLIRYRLGQEVNVDPGHVGRLERGERRHPGRDLVLRLSQALLDNSGDITLEDVDQLLKAAGHGPLPRNRISIRPYR